MKSQPKSIGQLFILGFPGATPPSSFLSFIAEEQIGGVILFEENCPGYQATRENIELIKRTLKSPSAFIAIDQEGGRVSRLRGIPVEYRSAAEYGAMGTVDRYAEEYGRAAGYMETLGININLAPVADIFTNENNSCLSGRCFGRDSETVSSFVRTSVQVAHANGLLCCLKHFPGLGASITDPHIATSEAPYSRTEWGVRERIPFVAGVEAGADMIMTTHVRVPKMDSSIVTGSIRIIHDLIRKDLEFDGPVITDDLTMAGADELGSMGERTVAAFISGHDMFLFGRDYENAIEAYDYFVDTVERDELESGRLRQAQLRVEGLKLKLERSLHR